MNKKIVKISKLLSLVLRHKPETLGLSLDAQGWIEVEVLIAAVNASGLELDRTLLEEVVSSNDKQRFAFSEDGASIRANQGHSLDIDLALVPREPPDVLYHGTATRFVESIRQDGLDKRKRHHVHLTLLPETALSVGSRYGKPILLAIDARQMYEKGANFFVSQNGVWLTEAVPVEYIRFDVGLTP